MFKFKEESSIWGRTLQAFSTIALLASVVVISPVYIVFGEKASERFSRPAVYVGLLLLAIFFIVSVGLLYTASRCGV